MNLPDILNVALGLVLLYVLLSSIASLVLDLLTNAARYREEILYVTINRLLAGLPDTPWNISQLVFDRIGRRIAEDSRILGWLRKRWVKDFQIRAPEDPDLVGPADPNRLDIAQRFWRHPKILSLVAPGADAPPAMEPATFAGVLIDIAIPRDAQSVLPDNRLALLRALDAPTDRAPRHLYETLRTLALSSQIPAGAVGEDLWQPFRQNIAAWFKEAAARSTDVYKRTMQRLLLAMGLLFALIINADTARVIDLLSHDRALRETVAAYAETVKTEREAAANSPAMPAATASVAPTTRPAVSSPALPATKSGASTVTPVPTRAAPTPTPTAVQHSASTSMSSLEDLKATRASLGKDIDRLRTLEQMGFPIGWSGPDHGFLAADTWFTRAHAYPIEYWTLTVAIAFAIVVGIKLIGLCATALAVSQGAPFWYDLLNRIIALRKGTSDIAPPPAAAADSSNGSASQAATGFAPATLLPLEIGHDLVAPATSFNPRKAYWLARASAAAYAPNPEIEALVKDTWKFHDYRFFDQAGTQCFCAHDKDIVLVAFRGTELKALNDILSDIRANPTPFLYGDYTDTSPAPARQVHRGFQEALDQIWDHGQPDDLLPLIRRWAKPPEEKTTRQVLLTGHSLGGALAALTFARLSKDCGPKGSFPVPTLYTFGCPKVGDITFAQELDRRFPERIFRLVNNLDVVPLLPPLLSAPFPQNIQAWDYHHAGHVYTFDQNGELRSEISGLGRLLSLASTVAVKDLKSALRANIDDHGVAYYVKRCEDLAKKA